MKLHSWLALLGGLLGLAAVFQILFFGWIFIGILLGFSLVCYFVASAFAIKVYKFTEIIRGFLIGSNSGLNAGLLFVPFSFLVKSLGIPSGFGQLGFEISLYLAIAFGIINFLSVFKWVSQLPIYQAIMGWANWFLPMSWPIVGLGFLFLLSSFLLSCVTGFRVKYLRLLKGKIDWGTGTFFIKGGLVANLNAWDTAFNMGNFSFVDMNSKNFHMKHEAGHALNLAAFGFLFHLVGFFDEFVFQRGVRAYSERIAESHDTGAHGANIPMWA